AVASQYSRSLHDALPIYRWWYVGPDPKRRRLPTGRRRRRCSVLLDRRRRERPYPPWTPAIRHRDWVYWRQKRPTTGPRTENRGRTTGTCPGRLPENEIRWHRTWNRPMRYSRHRI